VPNIKSAKKAHRQSLSHAELNRAQRSRLRSAVKRVRTATTPEDAKTAYAAAVQMLDRAARKRLIHPNNAARHKSRLAAAVRRLTK
jgi:small subunit ribosomal protein S20